MSRRWRNTGRGVDYWPWKNKRFAATSISQNWSLRIRLQQWTRWRRRKAGIMADFELNFEGRGRDLIGGGGGGGQRIHFQTLIASDYCLEDYLLHV